MHKLTATVHLLIIATTLAARSESLSKPASPLQLIDPPTALTLPQLNSDAVLSLWNPSAEDDTVTLSLTSFALPNQTPTLTLISPQTDRPIKLNKFTSTQIHLHLNPTSSVVPGIYSGILVVQDTDASHQPFAQHLTVIVPATQPAVAKLSTIVWRIIPFLPLWSNNIQVPLKNLPPIDSLNTNAPVGYLLSDTTGWASVHLLQPANSIAHLKVDHLLHTGRYEGDIVFDRPDNASKSSSLTLTVIAKDIVLWPILITALGIWLAFMTKRYLGVTRVTWALRQQEATLGALFTNAQDRFEASTKATPFASYSISDDVTRQRAVILALLDTVEQNPWTTDIHTDDSYKKAVSALESVQAGVAAFAQLGLELRALATALIQVGPAINGALMLPHTASPADPDFLVPAQHLLIGDPNLRIAAIEPLQKQVVDTTAFIAAWLHLNADAANATGTYNQLQKNLNLDQDQQDTLTTTGNQLAAVWVRLWKAQTRDDLEKINANGGDLDSAEISLATLQTATTRTLPKAAIGITSFTPSVMRKLRAATIFTPAIHRWPANDDRRFKMITQSIQRGDTLTTFLAFLIALLTGLNSNYLGKPFGSLQDYIVLFLWAAGTKASLDIVLAVVDRFAPAVAEHKPTT
jgi:hypothetical protein